MNKEYSVRAKLEYKPPDVGGHPNKLPMEVGPFIIDQSRNIKYYYINVIGADLGEEPPVLDNDYPISELYVDTKIIVPPGQSVSITAEDKLNELECLFRLFQTGYICIRCHMVWDPKEAQPGGLIIDRRMFEAKFSHIGDKPETPYLSRPEYNMDNGKLNGFKSFFDQYYEIIKSKQQPLYIAINRFSSSYEQRTLADRLVDLMIAVEALVGSQAKGTAAMAKRSACILFPPGQAREAASKQIKKDGGYYDERSRLSHGDKLDTSLTEGQVENFEDQVRRLIVKHLDYGVLLSSLTSEKDIDQLLWKK